MSPIDQIRAVAEAKGDDFDAMLAEYLRDGIVLSNPQAFVMAFPLSHEGRAAWFIKAAAGDLKQVARFFYFFPRRDVIIFDRSKGTAGRRAYPAQKLLRRIHYP